jgi:hypothetical protein
MHLLLLLFIRPELITEKFFFPQSTHTGCVAVTLAVCVAASSSVCVAASSAVQETGIFRFRRRQQERHIMHVIPLLSVTPPLKEFSTTVTVGT